MTSSTTPLVGRTTTSGPPPAAEVGRVVGGGRMTLVPVLALPPRTWPRTIRSDPAIASVAASLASVKTPRPAPPAAFQKAGRKRWTSVLGSVRCTDHGRSAISGGGGGVLLRAARSRSRASISKSGSFIECPLPQARYGGAEPAGLHDVGT